MDHPAAEAFAQRWVADWNSGDLDRILEHYDEAVQLTSATARRLGASTTGTVTGRAALAAYFRTGLDRAPDLSFDLLAVFAGIGGLTVVYRNHVRQLCAETMLVTDGVVHTAHVHYAPEGPRP